MMDDDPMGTPAGDDQPDDSAGTVVPPAGAPDQPDETPDAGGDTGTGESTPAPEAPATGGDMPDSGGDAGSTTA